MAGGETGQAVNAGGAAAVAARNTGTSSVRASQRSDDAFGLSARLLHVYTLFTFVSVLALICSGGLVTSKGAGLAVPDWPNTYGYNMFAFPISRWVGGVFYEHSHRLIASGVGMLTLGLAGLLWRFERRRWMRWLGIEAALLVIFQGVLGGMRVVWLKDEIGIFHACIAQAFLVLIGFIALAASRWWQQAAQMKLSRFAAENAKALRTALFVVAGLIYLQLALGAMMRHAHAGLSIQDFPTAYGKVWPPTDVETVARINHERTGSLGLPPTSAAQIVLQMLHRVGAALIALGVCWVAWLTWRRRTDLPSGLRRLGLLGPGLIAVQITLGIYTIWTNKAADVATTHVAVGALSLVWAALLTIALTRWMNGGLQSETVRSEAVRQPMEALA